MTGGASQSAAPPGSDVRVDEPIAVVGSACRFPGAPDIGAYWRMLTEGGSGIGPVPSNRWDPSCLHRPDGGPGSIQSWRGGFLDDVRCVDWQSLRLAPAEARAMDPQHRLLLELAWEALEDSGIALHGDARGVGGVFIGLQASEYFRLLSRDWSKLNGYEVTGTSTGLAANRISHAFDLRGPSMAVDCGCAGGIAVLHQAMRSLWSGECDFAVVGAAELALSPDAAIAITATGMVSPSGASNPLGRGADGFVRSEGGGVLVLRPLSTVVASDRVYGLLLGSAILHNGANKWIVAPSRDRQVDTLTRAWRCSGISGSDIDHVELHATGSPQGDAVEVEALAEALDGAHRLRPCSISSVKGNLGHTGAASGMASVIKILLSLHNDAMPRHGDRYFESAVPPGLGLSLPTELAPWRETGRPSIAGVTALSLGGVNAHVVLCSAPDVDLERDATSGNTSALTLVLSARTPRALAALVDKYVMFLARCDAEGIALRDVCYSAAVGRTHHEYRAIGVGATCRDVLASLVDGSPGSPASSAGNRFLAGQDVQWESELPVGRRVSLPTYAWDRQAMWPRSLDAIALSRAPKDAVDVPADQELDQRTSPSLASDESAIVQEVSRLLGKPVDHTLDGDVPLIEMGMDSLAAQRLRLHLEDRFGLEVSINEILRGGIGALRARLRDTWRARNDRYGGVPRKPERHRI